MKKVSFALVSIILILIMIISVMSCTQSAPAPAQTQTVTVTATAPAASPAAPKVIKWTAEGMDPRPAWGPFKEGYTGSTGGAVSWGEWLEEASNGLIQIEWVEPNAVVPVTDIDTAVGQNVVQVGASFGAYYRGRVPETDIETGGVFLWQNDWQHYEGLHKYGIWEKFQEIYAKHNIYWIGRTTGGIIGLGSNFPVPGPDAVKGKKIRSTGVWAEYVKMLGATPVNMPMGEIYMASKLGTIDGWVSGVGVLESLGLKEVTKYFVVSPRISMSYSNILINMDEFKALPQDIQDLIDRDGPLAAFAITGSSWGCQDTCAANIAENQGVQLVSWDQYSSELMKKAVTEIWPVLEKNSPDSAELMAMIKRQMKDYGRID